MANIKNFIKNADKVINEICFPLNCTCDCCGNDLFNEPKLALCNKCFSSLPFIENACKKCGKPVKKNTACPDCQNYKYYFKQAISVFAYSKPIDDMIYRFKYGKEFHLKHTFAHFMALKFLSTNWKIDFCTYSPMSKEKEILRIHNQAKQLAEEFCNIVELELKKDVLLRDNSTTQTLLDREQRFLNIKNSLYVPNKKLVQDKNILVIDDTFTTGATANAISKTLLECGAKNVYVLTLSTVEIVKLFENH